MEPRMVGHSLRTGPARPLLLGCLLSAALALPACSEVAVGKIDTAPEADILAPLDSYQAFVGRPVTLTGVVRDEQVAPEDMTVLWLTSVDPQPEAIVVNPDGTTVATWTPAAAGSVSIVLRADADGVQAEDEISVTVVQNHAPVVAWVTPEDGATVGATTTLAAGATDDLDAPDTLALAWTANGAPLEGCPPSPEVDGAARCDADLPLGEVALCLAATDSMGESGEACIQVTANECADGDGDGVSGCDGDCDDADPAVHPGAAEGCDGIDTNCDGQDDADLVLYDPGRATLDNPPTDDVRALTASDYTTGAGTVDDPYELELASAGTYTLCEGMHRLLVRGTDSRANLEGVGDAQISAGSAAQSVVLLSGGSVALQGLTIRDGYGSGGSDGLDGGGIVMRNGDVSLTDCTITGNTAEQGGGLYMDGSGGHTLEITRSTIEENQSYGTGSYRGGGGLWVGGGAPDYPDTVVRVTDSVLSRNEAATYGGAAYVYVVVLSLEGSEVRDNVAASGGGLYTTYYSVLTASDTTFTGNTASDRGGALFSYQSPMTLDTVAVSGNSAVYGGGLYFNAPNVAGQDYALGTVDTTFTANLASDAGGAVYYGYDDTEDFSARRTTFHGNTAARAGAVYVHGTMSADTCDFGVGGDDNPPYDIESGTSSVHCDYDDDVSFGAATFASGCATDTR